MRLALAAVLVFTSAALAQDDPFLTGEALLAQVEKDCKEGCLIFNREKAAVFQVHLDKLITSKVKEAFRQGMAAQKAACASLI